MSPTWSIEINSALATHNGSSVTASSTDVLSACHPPTQMASLLGLIMASTTGLLSLQNYPSGRGPRKTVIKHLQKHWQQKPAMAVINDSNPCSVLLPLHPLSLIGLSSCHPWPLVWPQNSPLYININLNQQNQFPAKEGPISTTPPSCAPWHVLLPSMASTLEVSLW